VTAVGVKDAASPRPVMFGHFARFNDPTEIDSALEGPRFMEQFAPGAFARTLGELTPKVLFQHGKDMLGNQPLGVPREVREDTEGAFYQVDLFDGIPPLILDGLRAGAYGASFRFSVRHEDWIQRPGSSPSNPDGIPERTVREASVPEFSAVTFPAYPNASAKVRSLAEEMGPDGELRGAAFRDDTAMLRIQRGYGMVTPIRQLDGLRAGVSRLVVTHELVRGREHMFRPADSTDSATRSRLQAKRTTRTANAGPMNLLGQPFRLPRRPHELNLPARTRHGRVLP
jgi:HK97 family phage prohead protease